MSRSTGLLRLVVLLVIVLGPAAACGDDADSPSGDESSSSPAATSTTPTDDTAAGATEDEVRSCLEDSGIEVTAPGAESPLVGGVRSIGLQPGRGALGPGAVTAAVFVFPTEEAAFDLVDQWTTQDSFGSWAVRGNVAVWYDSATPAAALASAVEACMG